MINRVPTQFEQNEYSALAQDALENLRTIPDQVRYIVRQDLIRRGKLPSDAPQPATSPAQPQHPQAVRS